jgi:hypothetical protein
MRNDPSRWASPEDSGFGLCSFGITEAISGFIGTDIGLGATAGTIGAGAIEGGAVGAGISALTGGKPLTGALTGAVTGGALGGLTGPVADTLGVSTGTAGALVGAGANAAGAAVTHGNPITGAVEGALGGYLYGSGPGAGAGATSGASAAPVLGTLSDGTVLGASNATGGNMLLDDNGDPLTDSNGNILYGSPTNTTSNGMTINPVSQQTAGTAGGAGGSKAGGGISNTSLALGALAAAGSLLNKPQIGTYATPGPSSVQQSPLFNAPLNTAVPGRVAVAPSNLPTGAQPNYYSYGGPEQTYFTGNSLQNFGFARGGALSREFTTAQDGRYVRGPGTETSDSIPAMLSDHEYVLTAADLRRIGNGSYDRGAAMLDRDRKALARKVGEPQFPPKRGALNAGVRRVA